MALDVGAGETAGVAYRLYQAAFDRVPDAGGLGYWIDRLDHGVSAQAVADGFVHSAEFAALYGAGQSDHAFVDAVYGNVLHRAPDQGGADFWYQAIDAGVRRAEVLAAFSESNENVVAIGASIGNGVAFTPYHA